MQYTNSQILAAVLNRFAQPLIKEYAGSKIKQAAGYQIAENMIKKWFPVSPNYSLMNDISFAINGATDRAIVPVLNGFIAKMPDDMIPVIAHSIVDSALQNGKLDFIEGKLTFDKHDLEELKKLLEYNLPLDKTKEYEVITLPPETKVESTVYNNE